MHQLPSWNYSSRTHTVKCTPSNAHIYIPASAIYAYSPVHISYISALTKIVSRAHTMKHCIVRTPCHVWCHCLDKAGPSRFSFLATLLLFDKLPTNKFLLPPCYPTAVLPCNLLTKSTLLLCYPTAVLTCNRLTKSMLLPCYPSYCFNIWLLLEITWCLFCSACRPFQALQHPLVSAHVTHFLDTLQMLEWGLWQ